MAGVPFWWCGNITEVDELNRSVILAFEPWYNLMPFLLSLQRLWGILLNSCSNSFSAIVFLYSQAEVVSFNANLEGQSSTLRLNCPVSVWFHIFHISILIKMIFCEIGTLVKTPVGQMRKFIIAFPPIASKTLITVLTRSGKVSFLLLS